MNKYKVILCDPPWSYRNKKTGGSMKSGAEQKYPTLTVEQICSIPAPEIASRNSALFLWATTPMLPEAFQVMKSWGFTYKTAIYWRKIISLGMGFWFRGQVEQCLLGIKGNIKAFRLQRSNFIQSKAGKHSQKPLEMYEIIESIPDLVPRIELFAREPRQGWDTFGFDIDGKDISEALKLITQPKLAL